MEPVLGLHHMTAICGDAQANVDFHVDLLGLRPIKLTVNFDDPSAYHLYYADAVGTPGSVITFFPYPGGRGRSGDGQVVITHLRVPAGSLSYWQDRLADVAAPGAEDGTLDVADPDGILYRLHEGAPGGERFVPWAGSPVPVEHQIRGMIAVTLQEPDPTPTAFVLQQLLGFDHDGDDPRPEHVFRAGTDEVLLKGGTKGRGNGGPGTVHHIAFRARDDAHHAEIRRILVENRVGVTEVRDRDYFHSIYFREPGGVLFEIATDNPGFAIDEPVESLGASLRLPAMHEPRRAEIEANLPPLRFFRG